MNLSRSDECLLPALGLSLCVHVNVIGGLIGIPQSEEMRLTPLCLWLVLHKLN